MQNVRTPTSVTPPTCAKLATKTASHATTQQLTVQLALLQVASHTCRKHNVCRSVMLDGSVSIITAKFARHLALRALQLLTSALLARLGTYSVLSVLLLVQLVTLQTVKSVLAVILNASYALLL